MLKRLAIVASMMVVSCAFAATTVVKMYRTAPGVKHGQYVGTVTFKDYRLHGRTMGVLVIPNLRGLPAGMHGFHIHQMPSCADMGKAAGGHFDPAKTGKHLGPYDPNGHLGDLPVLMVANNGTATTPVLAPRLRVAYLAHHSVMIHADGDNYSDHPKALGGGGARIACGVIQ